MTYLENTGADPSFLNGATIGVVGFGNQGAAQAACLRDEGLEVLVFLRDFAHSATADRARSQGFTVAKPADLARCRVIAILAPDEAHETILEHLVQTHARAGALLVFAHGFALREGASPRHDLDVALVVPLGPGALLRERYVAGTGLAGLLAMVRDVTGQAKTAALAYAARLRMTRAGLLPTTLEEEVVSDLFSEQAVLVGGAVELLRAAWETLVEGGISPEVAYYSCVNELQQIMDLVVREGPAGMRRRISTTARFGGLTRGPRIIGPESRRALKEIFAEIQSGKFSAEWKEERKRGTPLLDRLVRAEAAHPLEESGRRIRNKSAGGVDSPQENS